MLLGLSQVTRKRLGGTEVSSRAKQKSMCSDKGSGGPPECNTQKIVEKRKTK